MTEGEINHDGDTDSRSCPVVFQPQGIVLVCRREGLFVDQATPALVALPGFPSDMLGRPLHELFHFAEPQLLEDADPADLIYGTALGGTVVEGNARMHGDNVVLELEPHATAQAKPLPLERHLRKLHEELRCAGSRRELIELAITEIRRLAQFQRVGAIFFDGPTDLVSPWMGDARLAESVRAFTRRGESRLAGRSQYVRDTSADAVAMIGRERATWDNIRALLDEVSLAASPESPELALLGVRTYLSLPLRIRGTVLGRLIAYNASTPFPLLPRARLVLEGLARLVAEQLDHLDTQERTMVEIRRLSEAESAKDAFIAALAHELRNQLHVASGWVAALRTPELNKTNAHRALTVVEKTLRAQQKLLDDMLDLTAAMRGKLVLDLQPVDPAKLVSDVLEACGPAIAAKSLNVERRVEADLDRVLVDQDRMSQILLNLLANATKFTPPEGTLRIATRPAGEMVEFIIQDSGTGIPADFLDHVFDPFQQSTSNHQSPGIGIGLSIVKHLVELHGGSVKATSAGPGKGATFTVCLPRSR